MEGQKNKSGWVVILLVVIVLVIVGVSSGKNKKPADVADTSPITIGFVGPLTGDVASLGEGTRNSMQLWADGVNAAGGINGRQVNVVYEDGKCNGQDAATAVQKLITVDKVQAIVGGDCSGEMLAMAPIAEQNKVVLVSPSATAPAISNAGDYIFRVAPSDNAFSKKLADALAANKFQKVAMISEKTDYAQGLRTAFTSDAATNGLQIVDDEQYTTEESDLKPNVENINKAKADVIFMNAQSAVTATRIMKQLRATGNKTPVYCIQVCTDPAFVTSGSFTEGLTAMDITPYSDKTAGDAYAAQYKAKFGADSAYPTFSNMTHDAANILQNAIAAVGNNGEAIKGYLYTMPPYAGLVGNITFDSNGDPVGIDSYTVKVIKNGALVDTVPAAGSPQSADPSTVATGSAPAAPSASGAAIQTGTTPAPATTPVKTGK